MGGYHLEQERAAVLTRDVLEGQPEDRCLRQLAPEWALAPLEPEGAEYRVSPVGPT